MNSFLNASFHLEDLSKGFAFWPGISTAPGYPQQWCLQGTSRSRFQPQREPSKPHSKPHSFQPGPSCAASCRARPCLGITAPSGQGEAQRNQILL